MVTLKDVAKLAEVSVSTVSIVINGKSKERSIPSTTYNKVMKAIDELGYQPNVSARRLRNLDRAKPIIALYWTLDARTNMLAALLAGIQSEIEKKQFDFELVIRIYTNDQIAKDAKEIMNNTYNGIIIGATSEADLAYLESLSPRMPIVLINRQSKKFSTVYVDSGEVAIEAVSLLTKQSVQHIGVVAVESPYVASNQRINAFLEECRKQHIVVDQSHIITAPNSLAGGVTAAEKYLQMTDRPKTIFCESDTIVMGMIHEFNRLKIKIPEEVAIISIGMTGPDATQYSTPPITAIDIPSEQIAAAAISILYKSLSQKNLHERLLPVHQKIAPTTYIRASFPLPPDDNP
ncbi:LacI family DNA-binding transcriptional regulator [Paenibacillus polymyxa]|uniref:LacI family DNA-binding transcriptional regulator n=1 Tax=Paenibacillus polymyxa TaxID=1406 RepID=UPI002ED0B7D0|nr:LacI family DNA-binding transcriptional regulator [Paenibacillus polymyxa]